MSDIIQLSTGKQIYANNGFVGINEALEISGGYDSFIPEACCVKIHGYIEKEPLTSEEKIELGDRMIKLWELYKIKACEKT